MKKTSPIYVWPQTTVTFEKRPIRVARKKRMRRRELLLPWGGSAVVTKEACAKGRSQGKHLLKRIEKYISRKWVREAIKIRLREDRMFPLVNGSTFSHISIENFSRGVLEEASATVHLKKILFPRDTSRYRKEGTALGAVTIL